MTKKMQQFDNLPLLPCKL